MFDAIMYGVIMSHANMLGAVMFYGDAVSVVEYNSI